MTHSLAPTSADTRFWDRTARKYATDPIADLAGYERTLDRMRELLVQGAGAGRVLEFGCGTGSTALALADAARRIEASDISAEMIAIAVEKAAMQGCRNVSFAVAAPETAGWPEGAFDVAYGMNVLHLVRDRGAVLAAVRRALRPGGLFMSKTPCLTEMTPLIRLAVPLMRAIGKAPHVTFFSADTLRSDITAAGFDVIEMARHGTRGRDIRPFILARRR
ncbi:MAG: class I SAM-dependent methyltransferase [Paracoccus sp. (in: a-proteobacteria)]|uniref:class I SAM-dependent methyltransferase n=1 Tax=Paracoccus sp. TaxID=267 RepID=UPI0026DEEA4E|nr:class I SAM-dependent methyltransferase [Paracoccus sp. (in: a-proteobacteria)]MDO5631961.1 class I SAM-dependent methyltransferase [Paracoccus sp. (in: a-proteobacteria)]